jgi:anaerobic selenocysteine-containing dehydrogenase
MLTWGATYYPYGENIARTGVYLQAMTGNIGVPGGHYPGVNYPVYAWHIPGWPTASYQRNAPPRDFDTGAATFKTYMWQDAVLLREDYEKGIISKKESECNWRKSTK